MRPKKILVIGTLPPPTGGMETVMEQMCNLKMDDYEIIPFNVAKNKLIKSNILFNLLNFAYNCIKLFMISLIKHIDIIHIHSSSAKGFWQKAVYFKILKFLKKKTILHMHGANFKEWYNSLSNIKRKQVQKVLDDSDAIIVLSESWKDYYSKISNNKQIFVINNSIEDIDFSKYKRIYSKDEFTILFLSRVCKRKGVYDLLEAIKLINNPKIKFVFVGPYENEENFFKEIDRLKIRDNCKFVGEIIGTERLKYFASADVYILPSYAEGLPVAVLEAMSFGLPIISTNVGAIPEVIKKNNGILIKPGDITNLKKAILTLYKNKNLRNNMSKNNLTEIKNKYTSNIFKKNLIKAYSKLDNKK